MIKHWTLKKGFVNFNNEMIAYHKFPFISFDKWNGALGRYLMFTICLFHTRLYIGWYYKLNK
jgi:hypothetical protein